MDALGDTAGELVGTVVTVVGVVFEGVVLIGEGVGRIMDEGFFGAFFSEGLIKFETHGVKVDDGDFLLLTNLADGLGEVGEGLLRFSVFPAAAFHGGDEDGVGFLFAGGGEVAFEVFFVAGEGSGTFAFVLLIVVAELDEEVVAGLDGGEDFFESSFSAEAVEGAAGFGVVGDGDAGLEEGGKHLAPSGPGGFGLVGDGGVSGEIDGGGFRSGFDFQGGQGRAIGEEFEREAGVPVGQVEVGVAAESDAFGVGDFWRAGVDGELAGAVFGNNLRGEHEAAGF